MRTKIILLLAISLFLLQHATAQQHPWEEYGYKPRVKTLSNGKYQEFHDWDTIVHIGSVIFDRHNGKILGKVENDSIGGEERMKPYVVSRWISPDPLTEEFPDWSPYNYVEGNPIRFIDPDGRSSQSITKTIIDPDGKIIFHEPPSAKNGWDDNIYLGDASNSDGNTNGLSVVGRESKGYQYNVGDYVRVGDLSNQGIKLLFDGFDVITRDERLGYAMMAIFDPEIIGTIFMLYYVPGSQISPKRFSLNSLGAAGSKDIKFSGAVVKHLKNPKRAVPTQLLREVVRGKAYPDPQGTRSLAYYAKMSKNGKMYNLKVIYDKSSKTIRHFHYSTDAMGPLPKIK